MWTSMRSATVLTATCLLLSAAGQPARAGQPERGELSTYVVVQNDQTVNVEARDGQVRKVTVNGQEVPASRVRREGDTLRVVDTDGKVIATVRLAPGGGEREIERGRGDTEEHRGADAARRAAESARQLARRAREAGALARDRVLAQAEGGPRVMLGVTPEEPSEALAAQLGLEREEVTVLTSVSDGLPAANAGLKVYDIVVAIDGQKPAGPEALRKAIRARQPGQELKLTILRGGQKQDVSVKLEAVNAAAENDEESEMERDLREAFKDMPRQMEEAFRDMPRQIEEGFKGRARVYRFDQGQGGAAPLPPTPPGVMPHGPGARPFVLVQPETGERLSERFERLEERFERLEERLDRVTELLEKLAERRQP